MSDNAFAAAAATEQPADPAPADPQPADVLPPLNDRIPEKYRVVKDDGSFDLEASTGKLLDSYSNLEKRMGSGDAPPKSPEEYAPEVPEGFDLEALKADPMYQDFLKGAHSRGVSNKTLGWVLEEFGKRQAALSANDGQMSVEELRSELAPVWGDDPKAFDANIQSGLRAIKAYMPGITQEQLATIPNHPIIAQLLAAVGKEVGEDTRVSAGAIDGKDFDAQVAEITAELAMLPERDARRAILLDKKAALFAKRYSKK